MTLHQNVEHHLIERRAGWQPTALATTQAPPVANSETGAPRRHVHVEPTGLGHDEIQYLQQREVLKRTAHRHDSESAIWPMDLSGLELLNAQQGIQPNGQPRELSNLLAGHHHTGHE